MKLDTEFWKRIAIRILLVLIGFLMFAISETIQGASSAGETRHSDVGQTSTIER